MEKRAIRIMIVGIVAACIIVAGVGVYFMLKGSEGGGPGGGAEAMGIPRYPGATEFLVPSEMKSGFGVPAEATCEGYTTSAGAEDVMDWYKNQMDDWALMSESSFSPQDQPEMTNYMQHYKKGENGAFIFAMSDPHIGGATVLGIATGPWSLIGGCGVFGGEVGAEKNWIVIGSTYSAENGHYDVFAEELGVEVRGHIRDIYGDPIAESLVEVFTQEETHNYAVRASPPQPSVLENGFYRFSFMTKMKMISSDNFELQVDVSLPFAGNIVLMAYDQNGVPMRKENFDQDIFKVFLYATDLDGVISYYEFTYLHDEYSAERDWSENLKVPTVLIPLTAPRVINSIWEVPGFGEVMLKADNDGNGFTANNKGDLIAINLNYELAKTHYGILDQDHRSYSEAGYSISDNTVQMIQKAKAYLDNASVPGRSENERAALSDISLRYTLYAGEQLEFEKAQADIEANRKTDVTLKVVDESGSPLSGASVSYQQVSHDFLFGVTNDVHPPHHDPLNLDLVESAGINHVANLLDWGVMEPIPSWYNWEHMEYLGFEDLTQRGFTIMGHGLLMFGSNTTPGYLHEMNFEQVKEEAHEYISTIVVKYEGKIRFWNVNEPGAWWANCLNFSPQQMLEIIKMATETVKDADPSAQTMINFPYPAGESTRLRYAKPEYSYSYVPFEFINMLIEENVDFDVIGLQSYYGCRSWGYPARDISSMSHLLDWYSGFNKPIHCTEVTVPSYDPGEDYLGYWHDRPSEKTQSDWLKYFYTVAFSKPYVYSIAWWDVNDVDSFVPGGGLLDENDNPKPAYYTLKDLISSWTTNGTATSDENGFISFRGFAGDYEITSGNKVARVHISKDDNEATVVLKELEEGAPPVEGIPIVYVVVGVVAIVAVIGLVFALKRR